MTTLVVLVVVGGAGAAPRADSFTVITLHHAPTGLTIRVPEGFSLQFRKGVYVLRKGSTSMSFSRLATVASPAQVSEALFKALGGRVLIRQGDGRHRVGQVVNGKRGDTFVVERIGCPTRGHDEHVVDGAAGCPRDAPPDRTWSTRWRVAEGAEGDTAEVDSAAAVPLPRRRRDSARAHRELERPELRRRDHRLQPEQRVVPVRVLLNVPLTAPGATPANIIIGPYLNAVQALVTVMPRISSARNIKVRRVLVDAALPSFTSSGMILFDYKVNGKPWNGVATVGTDDPSKYSNFLWNFYFSGIGVPTGSDPSIGVGLLRSWKSSDPSGAIAAQNTGLSRPINETNQIWQSTNEFRSRIADQQSRDVGCLLQGYYIVEDNARQYGLPLSPAARSTPTSSRGPRVATCLLHRDLA